MGVMVGLAGAGLLGGFDPLPVLLGQPLFGDSLALQLLHDLADDFRRLDLIRMGFLGVTGNLLGFLLGGPFDDLPDIGLLHLLHIVLPRAGH